MAGARFLSFRLLLAATVAQLIALSSSASAQVRPRIMVAFDTSGSMGLDLNGLPTFGDGVLTNCSARTSGAYTYQCGTNCTAGIDTNCDGLINDSRMFVAKSALADIVSAYGDVDWSLSRFHQDQGTNIQCPRFQDYECNGGGPYVSSVGNPQCNAGTTCDIFSPTWESFWPAACRPGTAAGGPRFRARTGGMSPTVCYNYRGTCTGGDILVGFPDMGPWAGRDSVPGILTWLDGVETNFVNDTTMGAYCDADAAGNCELRPEGGTPLAGLLNSVSTYMMPIRTADSAASCRPYSVILMTDGVESCGGTPATAAATLRAAGILTYVVGLAIDAGSRPTLNAIATSGGTDAGGAGGDTAFFADDPVTLSAGLADIVQRSLLFEVCNGADDDCDTRVDEGVLNACGRCGAVPAETCNGADDDCDGTVDDGVLNACGRCGAVPAETCNRSDDDCDGRIDEGGVCGACVPNTEVCDNIDNDCDTRIDEMVTRTCGVTLGRCREGTQSCSAGVWGACGGTFVGPTTETCNNMDDDCNGVVDGFTEACAGSSTGVCRPGARTCTAGSYGMCIGAVGPSTELCDLLDNDCDSRTDEMASGTGASCGSMIGACMPGTLQCVMGALTCTGGTSPGTETCNALDDDCDGRTDEGVATMGPCGPSTGECDPGVLTCVGGSFACVGARGPTGEICNLLDDDCDARTDEMNPGGGMPCGTDAGECSRGTTQCTMGMLTCVGGTGPMAESCNLRDDDCDNLTDEGNPGGGAACGATDEGLCERGALACSGGMLVCVGEVGPTAERCNGLDDDCDASTDEGNPEGGMACGTDTGECGPGTTRCVGGMLECQGETGPVAETCNGLDDDCDTAVDEDLGVGEACGTDTGECVPGVNRCIGGMVVCDGALGGMDETCNGLDDDCDAMTDEGLGLGDACGTDEGLCMAGRQMCSDGRIICVGGVEPGVESCDCEDNDCDMATDEEPPTGLCPPGSACVECGCALPCVPGEFGPLCPTGRAPFMRGEECFCVAERCNATTCAGETHTASDGSVQCAPESEGVSSCVCRNNECTFPCDGVVCSEGTVCDPDDPMGRCVEDSCRGLGCPDDQICNLDTGDCESDPCATAGCAADQACRDGVCESSCASVECADGERCERGTCVTDRCAAVTCGTGEVCDPATGACVGSMCGGVMCPAGTECDPLTGDCDRDPCDTLTCPEGQVCVEGECSREMPRPDGGMPGVDAGPRIDAGIDAGDVDPNTRVLAAGGGGCLCAVPGAPSGAGSQGGGAVVAALLGLALVLRRRARRGPGAARARPFRLGRRALSAVGAAALVATSAGSSGCSVDPFCLDCVDASVPLDSGPADSGVRDSGADTGRPDTGAGDAGQDAGDAGCAVDRPETCNAFDDDCDGRIDEGIETDTDEENCGGCGVVCAPPGAFGECVAGDCTISMCDVGRYDRDMNPDNGCETRCLPTATDDTLCDLRDNDCDFEVDEDVDTNTDPLNCGRCGRTCRFVHAAASCAAGVCELGACEAGFYDLDTLPGNGCEYACTPTGAERCNGSDDDCDGTIDEGDPGGGAACGISTGACEPGVERCVSGVVVCMGGVSSRAESCNGADDDCDGSTDEGNPGGGRACGSSVGTCASGREVCTAGALVCTGAIGPGTESCDGLDNDCDTRIDEGNPGGGGSCGIDTGECAFGTNQCRGGVLVCEGAVSGGAETCNGRDDDCDTRTDEGNPGGGGTCGTDVGACNPGAFTCSGGALSCVGAISGTAESCNSIDDDCDGRVDEGNPGGGASCGVGTGACEPGMLTCTGGAVQCIGATGPTVERCNTTDDDCDARTDEGFDLTIDVNNCGMCGRVCSLPNAVPRCTASACRILACNTGFVNADGSDANGCEYACTASGTEVCNGRDDDCDTRTDEGVSTANFCNPNGVCSATVPTCSGAGGWVCNYPVATYQSTETRCDGRDNDCDGQIDEPFPGINPATGAGLSCSVGTGACRRTGTYGCTMDGTNAVCSVTMPGTGTSESCNNIDDDCNGVVDDNIVPSTVPTVTVPRAGGGTFRIMQYEASRPDATSASAGSLSTVACSRADVVPWTTVTYAQAQAACCALNAGGTCGATGWNLCAAEDWEDACEAGMSCRWGTASCSTAGATLCNGEEYDSSGTTGDQDALFTTGSATFPMCYASWGAAGRIYDMSGNAKEWTSTETSPGSGIHQIRGGGYTNVERGRSCGFDFTVGGPTFAFPTTGFRCCFY